MLYTRDLEKEKTLYIIHGLETLHFGLRFAAAGKNVVVPIHALYKDAFLKPPEENKLLVRRKLDEPSGFLCLLLLCSGDSRSGGSGSRLLHPEHPEVGDEADVHIPLHLLGQRRQNLRAPEMHFC